MSPYVPNSLRKYRRVMGYSQKEVARMLGFKSAGRLSRWEKGEAMPSVENLLKLSFLYSTLPAELYPDLWKVIRGDLGEKKIKVIE